MEKATSGNIYLEDKNVTSLNRKGLCEYRRNDVGFVFQFYNLMPNLSSLENAMPPNKFNKVVFPAPELPKIITNSPSFNSKEILLTALTIIMSQLFMLIL